MKRLLLGLLLGCLLLPTWAQDKKATWTIIYYSAADTDLEPFMIGDLMEMQIVGSSDDVKIVVEMDRIEGHDEVNGNWTEARRFLIGKGDAKAPSSGDFQMDREAYINNLESLDPDEIGATQQEIDDLIAQARNASAQQFEELMLQDSAPLIKGVTAQGMQQTSLPSPAPAEADMGDPEHLAEFATWAIETYPAEHYALVLSDHGGGWTGVAFDESSGNDPLTLRDIDSALAATLKNTGLEKFDLVAFDACLMGQLEVYNVLAPYALYTIAAEEPIPGAGWEYVTPLQALVKDPSMSTVEIGKSIIDSYMDYYTNILTSYPTYDLHLIDLTKIDAVNKALDDFIAVVKKNPDAYIEAIGFARAKAQGFSQDDELAAAYFSSVDLADFMKKMKGYSDDRAIGDAADAVIKAADDAVLHSGASKELPGATGMAIYFPANVDDYALGDNNRIYPEQAGEVMAPWVNFLDVFHGTAEVVYEPAKTGLSIDITAVVPSDYDASIYEPPAIIFHTDGSGVVDLQFYASLKVDDGLYVIVDAAALESAEFTEEGDQLPPFPEGPEVSEFQWNVESPVVVDAKGNSELITLITNKDNDDVSSVSGIYRTRDGKESDAYIIFDLETQTMQAIYGLQEGVVGQALGEIKVRSGDTFEPYYLVLDEKGTITREPSDTRLVLGDEPLKYDYYAAPSGDYKLAIWMEDIAGNIVQDTIEFSIDNEDLDQDWRGLKDIDSGISFLYPWSWGDSTTTLYDNGGYALELQNEEGTQSISVDIFDEEFGVTSLDDLVDNATASIEGYGAMGDPETVEAGYEDYEEEAVVIPYTYVADDGEDRLGWLVLVYNDDNELGYQVDIDVRAEDESEGQTLLTYVLDTLYFDYPSEVE